MLRLSWLYLLLVPLALFAQDLYNQPELKWQTFETKNFHVYYTPGLEDVASLAAEAAEEVHEPLCELYQYRPDTKVSLIFSDTDDIANAGSYFQSNKIKFYATSMNWDFRGTHNWIRNVVTHEYTHMIQLGSTRKWSRSFPAGYFQFLGYEEERRPDVLYGYPNRLISWPIPSVTIPAWFAEGTAQFQFTGTGYDFWDSHRDMLLRQATLSHRLLSFEEMGYFGKTSLESEGVYNQGFSLCKYIAEHGGGADALGKISRKMSSLLPITLSRAMKDVTGKSGEQWYDEWKAYLEQSYGSVKSDLAPTLTAADTLPTTGYVNLFPRLSPDGKQIAFISNKNRDYYGQSSLYLFNSDSNKAKLIAPAVHGGIAWLPDGSGVIFSRHIQSAKSGYLQNDLYLYRIKEEDEIRLSRGLRAESCDVSPDGKHIVLTINEHGRRELAIAPLPEIKNKKMDVITRDDLLLRRPSLPHEQYYLPRWSPDGKRIVAAQHLKEGRSIVIFDVADDFASLAVSQTFEGRNVELRDPTWSEDGTSLYCAWDESGISNIYRIDLKSQEREQLTSVLGGAYYPDVRSGTLTYSDFCEQGFRVCKLSNPTAVRTPRNSLDERTAYQAMVPEPKFDIDTKQHSAKPYHPVFEKLYWFPRVAFDYGTFKPGTYVLINDVLEKLNFIGGLAVNTKGDYDAFGTVEYRELYPSLFMDIYHIQRRLTHFFADSSRIIGENPGPEPVYDKFRIRYRYELSEVDGGLKFPLGAGRSLKFMGIYDRYIAHNRFDDETAISVNYFKGWSARVGYYTDQRRRTLVSEISPSSGHKGYFELTRANQNFFTGIEIGGNSLGLQEVYQPYSYWMAEGGLEKYWTLPGWDHSLEARVRGGYIDEHVDPFFHLYAGGLPGMRGYSFYSLGGERTAVGTITYRFPIDRRANVNLWPLSLNRVYGQFFADVGNAWSGEFKSGDLRKDIGAGLRMQLHSFYSYPTAISFDLAYGLDKFTVFEDNVGTDYGKELRYYLTLLFDFYSPFSDNIPVGEH